MDPGRAKWVEAVFTVNVEGLVNEEFRNIIIKWNVDGQEDW